jgi:hypothetical protein
MILSIVDAESLYLSAKALTSVMVSELEMKWHQPALEKLEKMMALAMQEQLSAQPQEQLDMEENYGVNYQQ